MNPIRQEVFNEVDDERDRQDSRWGETFDAQNTASDWVATIVHYLGRAVTLPFHSLRYRQSLIKVAALAVAAVERLD